MYKLAKNFKRHIPAFHTKTELKNNLNTMKSVTDTMAA